MIRHPPPRSLANFVPITSFHLIGFRAICLGWRFPQSWDIGGKEEGERTTQWCWLRSEDSSVLESDKKGQDATAKKREAVRFQFLVENSFFLEFGFSEYGGIGKMSFYTSQRLLSWAIFRSPQKLTRRTGEGGDKENGCTAAGVRLTPPLLPHISLIPTMCQTKSWPPLRAAGWNCLRENATFDFPLWLIVPHAVLVIAEGPLYSCCRALFLGSLYAVR